LLYPNFGPKNTNQTFLSCISSHLICLWSIAFFFAFYFNVICKIHMQGYSSHFLCQNFFQSFKNLLESFQIVWISPCFILCQNPFQNLHLKSFWVSFAPRGILVFSSVRTLFKSWKIVSESFNVAYMSLWFNSLLKIHFKTRIWVIFSRFSPRGILVISHEISAERYFKVPHLSHWFVLVRFVNFNRFTLRLVKFTNF
jgi:hypothetical protein